MRRAIYIAAVVVSGLLTQAGFAQQPGTAPAAAQPKQESAATSAPMPAEVDKQFAKMQEQLFGDTAPAHAATRYMTATPLRGSGMFAAVARQARILRLSAVSTPIRRSETP